jgi:hypothetical protein
MRTMLIALALTAFSGTAFAKGKKDKGVANKKSGVRVKITQNLYDIEKSTDNSAGDESDPFQTNTFNLLDGGARTEITYKLGNGFEAGGIVGYDNWKTTFDGDGVASGNGMRALATVAYNFDIGDNAAFIQPMAGLARASSTPEDGDETLMKGLELGGAVGVRIKLFKRVFIDPQFEFTQTKWGAEFDGDTVENVDGDDWEMKQTNMGLRWGLNVLI